MYVSPWNLVILFPCSIKSFEFHCELTNEVSFEVMDPSSEEDQAV